MQEYVLGRLDCGSKVENSAADYLRNLEVVEAIYASDELGRRVTLD